MKGNDGIIDIKDSIENDAVLLKCFLLFFLRMELMIKMDQACGLLKFVSLLKLSGYDYP